MPLLKIEGHLHLCPTSNSTYFRHQTYGATQLFIIYCPPHFSVLYYHIFLSLHCGVQL